MAVSTKLTPIQSVTVIALDGPGRCVLRVHHWGELADSDRDWIRVYGEELLGYIVRSGLQVRLLEVGPWGEFEPRRRRPANVLLIKTPVRRSWLDRLLRR